MAGKKDRLQPLMREIRSYIGEEAVRRALSGERADERIGSIMDLLREGVDKSSLGVYNGMFHYFGGRIYEPMSDVEFEDVIFDLVKSMGATSADLTKVDGIIRVCKRKAKTKKLVIDKDKVVFKNCVVDTRDRKVYKFGREHVQFASLDYDYDRLAECSLWRRFLDEVLPNKVFQVILQEFLGSLFVDRREAKMETLMILKGDGSNGKSVIMDTVVGVLGQESVSSFGLDELIGGGTERKRNLATINGKRLNYCSETNTVEIDGNSGTLKALISGEPMEARPIYGDNFTTDSLPMIMINANKLPMIRDWGVGMKRRLCILPFDTHIAKARQNKNLSAELRNEYGGILNWILDGRDKFAEQGYKLTDSKLLDRRLDEYEAENNVALRFMMNLGFSPVCQYGEDAFYVTAGELYMQFERWCDANCEYCINKTKFGALLKEAGFLKRRFGSGYQYKCYGEEAIKQGDKVRGLTERAQRRAAFKMRIKRSTKYTEEQRASYEREVGSELAIGHKELAEYLRCPLHVVAHMYRKGEFLGCYTRRGIMILYSLDEIDKINTEAWRERYFSKQHMREEAAELRAMASDYAMNGFD